MSQGVGEIFCLPKTAWPPTYPAVQLLNYSFPNYDVGNNKGENMKNVQVLNAIMIGEYTEPTSENTDKKDNSSSSSNKNSSSSSSSSKNSSSSSSSSSSAGSPPTGEALPIAAGAAAFTALTVGMLSHKKKH
ncbi:hypothetical protein [Methanobrevibacter sp.]|uniref:hypothetical protein n=1 Tax=Methanobrevibacter sp. TaxID=66852 RepID=UPI0038904DDD